MPNTNNNNSRRGRGRPSLGNVERLYQRFVSAGRAGLVMSEVSREFGWTPETARTMISQVRTRHNCRIIFDGRSSTYRLLEETPPAIANPCGEIPLTPESPTPVVAQPAEDTQESIIEALEAIPGYNRNQFNWSNWLQTYISGIYETISVDNILGTSRFSHIQYRVRRFISRERARRLAPLATPALEPIEVIATALNEFDDAGIEWWTNWLNRRVTGDRRDAPVINFLSSEEDFNDEIRNRVRNWITRSREAVPATSDTIECVANELASITNDTAYAWVRWLEARIIGPFRNDNIRQSLLDSTYDGVRERVYTFVENARARRNGQIATPATNSDSLWRGIPAEVAIYYRERTLDLRQ